MGVDAAESLQLLGQRLRLGADGIAAAPPVERVEHHISIVFDADRRTGIARGDGTVKLGAQLAVIQQQIAAAHGLRHLVPGGIGRLNGQRKLHAGRKRQQQLIGRAVNRGREHIGVFWNGHGDVRINYILHEKRHGAADGGLSLHDLQNDVSPMAGVAGFGGEIPCQEIDAAGCPCAAC